MSGGRKTSLRDSLATLGLGAHATLLAGVLLVAVAAAAPIALAASGLPGLVAALVAAAVCLVGAELALALAALFHGPAAAMYALAVGMLARTVVPMLLGVTLHLAVPELAAAGMIFYLLGFYFVALAAETALLVARIPAGTSGKAV
jgi:hypothetical protein